MIEAMSPPPANPYDDHLADMLLERSDPAEVDLTLDLVVERLDLLPGDRVFDQCCGIGSLAVPLAGRGFEVVGWDLSAAYIERARSRARSAGVRVELYAADALEFVPRSPCAGGFNWWTSFGYVGNEDASLQMMARAREALAPGGRYLVDFVNVPFFLARFEPTVVSRRSGPEGETVLLREHRVDVKRGVLAKRWTYFLPGGGRVEHASEVRLYQPWELASALEQVGFVAVELLGGLDGRPLEIDSPRCVLVARRADEA